MRHYLLYGYGGACNHGSEASAKEEIKFLRRISPGCRITLSTHFPDYDIRFGVEADEIIGRNMSGNTPEEIYAETIRQITPDTICLSVGGDIYCYPNWERYAAIHYAILERGAKSLLWRCSLDPSALNGEMLSAIRSHHLIAARESITYNALRNLGIENVVHTADMAFSLPKIPVGLPLKPYVVLNLSPLIIRKNASAAAAYQFLIDKIISETNMNIALLPHVEIKVDCDTDALNLLKAPEDRLYRIPIGLRAENYKYIISQAELCVTARTHVAIAGWSSCTPTLVISYSVKSRGIAADLEQDDFVLDVDKLSEETLCDMFFKLYDERKMSRTILEKNVPACTVRLSSPEILAILQ